MRFEDLDVWKRATTILNNFHIRHSGLEPESRRRPREGGEPNHFLLDSCFRRNDKKI
jgi:hypothetical protein